MEAIPKTWNALVVDDLAEAREMLGERLSDVGFALSYAEDGLVALGAFECERLDLIVTDRKMPNLDGIGLLRRIREVSDVPVIVITAFASIPDCEEAMRVGANRYLEFRRDLDRVGEVARELVEDATSDRNVHLDVAMTASEVRERARRELQQELQSRLIECRGNIAEMARRMGRDRSTIRYHLHRLGMLDDGGRRKARSKSDFERAL